MVAGETTIRDEVICGLKSRKDIRIFTLFVTTLANTVSSTRGLAVILPIVGIDLDDAQ